MWADYYPVYTLVTYLLYVSHAGTESLVHPDLSLSPVAPGLGAQLASVGPWVTWSVKDAAETQAQTS